ncbi:hypothetical protein CK203_063015 [Vitis vinifera]|uniref:Uncharacterized protein n=1 Tax=Vitis vinifera TaxID=29760 RepID=A0A438G5V0_VITVI|nr:hypothetical protein CK203_063015 [Vitis vinifera]
MRESSLLGNPLGKRASAFVEVMTTLYGSTSSPWKHAEGCVPPKGRFTMTNLGLPLWIRVGGRLTKVSSQTYQRLDQKDMDSQIVTVDHFTTAMASIQDAIANLSQMIDGQQAQKVAPPLIIVPTLISENPHDRMDKLEQRIRQMRTSDGAIT